MLGTIQTNSLHGADTYVRYNKRLVAVRTFPSFLVY